MKSENRHTYLIIMICFLMIGTSMGLCSSGRTLYLTAITDALSLSRGAFSVTNTIRFLTTTIVNLYFGSLLNKLGTKKLICAGFVSLICFSVINTYATELWQFYAGSVFLGIGFSWTGTAMASTIIRRNCKSNIGALTGATLSANGIGGAVAVQLLSPIIFEEGNPFGYRNSYKLVTIVLAIVFLIVILFFKDSNNSQSDGKGKDKTRGVSVPGFEYEYIKKKPYFYMAIICVFITGMSLQGLGGIGVPHYYDIGLDKTYVAVTVSVSSVMLTISKFGVGYLYDRFGIRISANICYISNLISTFSIFLVANTSFGMSVAMSRSFFSAIALPLETVMLPLMVNELFGSKSFEKVLRYTTFSPPERPCRQGTGLLKYLNSLS